MTVTLNRCQQDTKITHRKIYTKMSFRYTKHGIRVLLLSVEKKKQFKARTIESEINGEFCEM